MQQQTSAWIPGLEGDPQRDPGARESVLKRRPAARMRWQRDQRILGESVDPDRRLSRQRVILGNGGDEFLLGHHRAPEARRRGRRETSEGEIEPTASHPAEQLD